MRRRDFLRLSGAAVPAVVAAGCGGGEQPKTTTEPFVNEGDARLLDLILFFEDASVAAYRVGAPLLRGRTLATARTFVEQEREHVAALTRAIRDLGGIPRKPKSLTEYRRSFPFLRDQADFLRFAVDLENRTVRSYIELIPKISRPELRRTASSMLAADAAHVSVLLGERGLPQVPDAFVTGTAHVG